jgi:hypothetical protein
MVNMVLTEDCYDSIPSPFIIRALLEEYTIIVTHGSEFDRFPGIPELEELVSSVAGESESEFMHELAVEAYETTYRFVKGCETYDQFYDLLEDGQFDEELLIDRDDFSHWEVRETILMYLQRHHIFFSIVSPNGDIAYFNQPVIGVW